MGFCEGCGECCINRYPVFDETKMKQIAEQTGLKPEEFSTLNYKEDTESGPVRNYNFRHKENGGCYFLDNERLCKINDIKPEMCERQYCTAFNLMNILLRSVLSNEDIDAFVRKYGKPGTLKLIPKIFEDAKDISLTEGDSLITGKKNLNDSIWEVVVADNEKVFKPEIFDPEKAKRIRALNRKNYRETLLKGIV